MTYIKSALISISLLNIFYIYGMNKGKIDSNDSYSKVSLNTIIVPTEKLNSLFHDYFKQTGKISISYIPDNLNTLISLLQKNNKEDAVICLTGLTNVQNQEKQQTVLEFFKKNGYFTVIDYLVHKKILSHENQTKIQNVVNKYACYSIGKYFSKYWNDPLHHFAEHGNAEAIECLIQNGIDVNIRNRFGETAIELAASNSNSMDSIKYLVENGTDQSSLRAALKAAKFSKAKKEIITYLREQVSKIPPSNPCQ